MLVALGVLGALTTLSAGCRQEDDGVTTPSSSSSSAGGSGGTGGEGGSGAGEPPGPPEPLAVLNWNTRNFFNDKDDTAGTAETVLSAAQYRQKREAVAAVLKELDPDTAVLQEVEHLSVLEDLNRNELAGAYPHLALVEGNDPRGIDVGVLSKIPFENVVSHVDDRFTKVGTQGPVYVFVRDCLEIHLRRGGRHVVLLAIHFRSKSPPDDADKRLAEAQRSRAIADAIAADDPTAAIAVLGDFNDLPGSPPFLAVAGSGEGAFDDVASTVPEADRWTFDFNGQLELIDHQMANPILRAMLDPGSVQLLHSAAAEAASDHAPILARYTISGAAR
jgi:endonuclease/exonuclease/phosphatase family metal-dependent hydrolase